MSTDRPYHRLHALLMDLLRCGNCNYIRLPAKTLVAKDSRSLGNGMLRVQGARSSEFTIQSIDL